MNFLLDTNVVSEWAKPAPNAGLMNWLALVDEDRLFLSAITITELRYGIQRLPVGKRRTKLNEWLGNELLLRFETRVLPVDLAVADDCGNLLARSHAQGRALEMPDALIAATAEVHQLTLVSRDIAAFKHLLPSTLNPWT